MTELTKIDENNVCLASSKEYADKYDRHVAKYGEPDSAIYMRLLIDASRRAREEYEAHEVFIRSQSPVKDTVYPIHVCAYCGKVKEPDKICPCQVGDTGADEGEYTGDCNPDHAGDTGDDGWIFCWSCFHFYPEDTKKWGKHVCGRRPWGKGDSDG